MYVSLSQGNKITLRLGKIQKINFCFHLTDHLTLSELPPFRKRQYLTEVRDDFHFDMSSTVFQMQLVSPDERLCSQAKFSYASDCSTRTHSQSDIPPSNDAWSLQLRCFLLACPFDPNNSKNLSQAFAKTSVAAS